MGSVFRGSPSLLRANASRFVKILLIGNYANDRQESMQRFAETLYAGFLECGHEVDLLRPPAILGRWGKASGGLGKWLGYFDKFLLFPRRLQGHLAAAEVVHICDHSNSMYVSSLGSKAHVVTCNDLLAVRSALGEFPQNATRFTGRILQRWIVNGLRRARYVTSISHATQRDLLRITGRKAEDGEVIHMGLNQAFSPVDRVEQDRALAGIFQRLDLPRPRRYLFHIGGNQWYKNRLGLLSIFAQVIGMVDFPLQLVIAGAALDSGQMSMAAKLGIVDRISFIGSVSSEDLRALYAGAEALVFPSLAEGFGWPIVEAQACGSRVLTSGRAPMDEIGGSACAYVDPDDAATAGRALAEMLTESAAERTVRVQEGLRNAEKYRTQKMIAHYLAVYKKVVEAGVGLTVRPL